MTNRKQRPCRSRNLCQGTALITSQTKTTQRNPGPTAMTNRPSHGDQTNMALTFGTLLSSQRTNTHRPGRYGERLGSGVACSTLHRPRRPEPRGSDRPTGDRTSIPAAPIESPAVRPGARTVFGMAFCPFPASRDKRTWCAREKSNRHRPAYRPWSRRGRQGAVSAPARPRCDVDRDGAPTSGRAGGRTLRGSTPRRRPWRC